MCAAPALAQENAPPTEPPSTELVEDERPLEVHGFVSQGFIVSSGNNYLARSKKGSFEFAEVGINFTQPLGDRLRVGVQLFAQDLGDTGNYNARFDWFYLDYRFNNWLGVRAGRAKLPLGLYNDISDVDAARVPILLPQSVYPVSNRNFLLAQTGVELYGYFALGPVGGLDYRLYGGTIILDSVPRPSSPMQVERIGVPYVVGGRLVWETPLEGLRAGFSLQALRLEGEIFYRPEATAPLVSMGALPMGFRGLVGFELPALLWVSSVEYVLRDFLFAAEYSRWHTRLESTAPVLLPQTDATSERLYGMVTYRVNPWLSPGAYYSMLFPDVDDRKGREAHQHDVAATLRFDITDHWLFKVEGHFMRGTAGANSQLNDGRPLRELQRDWFVVLAKTTVYF